MICAKCGSTIPSEARFCPHCGTHLHADKSPIAPQSSLLSSDTEKRDASSSKAQAHNPAMAQTSPRAAQTPQLPRMNAPAAPRQPGQPHLPGQPDQPRKRPSSATMVLSFIALLIVVVFEAIGVILAEVLGTEGNLTITAAASVGALLSMLALGAGASLLPSRPALGTAMRYGWWLLAANGLLTLFDIVAIFIDPEFSLADSWILSTLWILLYCLTVGIHEELAFRGLLLGGLLSKFGGTKRGILICCLVSSLLFGLAHVDWFTLSYTDPLAVVQALLKIAQMLIFGLIMAAIVVRTNNLVGPILLHALGDFILMFPSVGLMGIDLEVSYVSGGDDALPTIMIYLIVNALYLPLLFSSIRLFRTTDVPQFGPLRKRRTSTRS